VGSMMPRNPKHPLFLILVPAQACPTDALSLP
jgi:hypothetical protein